MNYVRFVMRKLGHYLSRQTSGRKLIPEIDGLRSIAIISVVIFHANANFSFFTDAASSAFDAWLDRIFDSGEFGVPLFFVISGFILALPFASHHLHGTKKVSLKKYLLRRITRLEPPYIFALTVFFLITMFRNGNLDQLPHYLASIAYVHNIVYGYASTITTVAWSLEVEVQFYLLAPFLTMIFRVPSALIRRATLAITITVMSYFFNVDHAIDGLSIISHGSYFLVGLLLADLYLSHKAKPNETSAEEDDSLPTPSARHYAWDIIAIVALSAVFLTRAYYIHPEILCPWLILIGYVAVFEGGWTRRLFRLPFIVILGGMCYTIYLWHFFIIIVLRRPWFSLFSPDSNPVDRLVYILAATVISVSISAVLFALIERPTMNPNWPRDLLRLVRRRGPSEH